MTIQQVDTVDIIHVDPISGDVVLSITDHLDWDETGEHVLLLQEKINTYLAFVESGELEDEYPSSRGHAVRIDIVCKYPPNELGKKFITDAAGIVCNAGFRMSYRVPEGTEKKRGVGKVEIQKQAD